MFARGFKGEKEVVDRRSKVTHFGLDAKVQFLGGWEECLAENHNYKLFLHTNSIGGVGSKVLACLTTLKLSGVDANKLYLATVGLTSMGPSDPVIN